MFKVILTEITIFILFLNSTLNYFIFPNFLNIDFTNQTLIIELFSNISIILASIFGMVIAIFLVSFQIFKKNYVSYSVRDFFKDANISLLFVIYLSTILISNLFYLSFFLFVISILFLYFIIKSILTSRYSNNKVKEVISRLNYDNIK